MKAPNIITLLYFGPERLWAKEIDGTPIARYTMDRLHETRFHEEIWAISSSSVTLNESDLPLKGIKKIVNEAIALPKLQASKCEHFVLLRAEDAFVCPDIIDKLYRLHLTRESEISIPKDCPPAVTGTVFKSSVFEKVSPLRLFKTCMKRTFWLNRRVSVTRHKLLEARQGIRRNDLTLHHEDSIGGLEWTLHRTDTTPGRMSTDFLLHHARHEFQACIETSRLSRRKIHTIAVLDLKDQEHLNLIASLFHYCLPKAEVTLITSSRGNTQEKGLFHRILHSQESHPGTQRSRKSDYNFFQQEKFDLCVIPSNGSGQDERARANELMKHLRIERIIRFGPRLESGRTHSIWMDRLLSATFTLSAIVKTLSSFIGRICSRLARLLLGKHHSPEKPV